MVVTDGCEEIISTLGVCLLSSFTCSEGQSYQLLKVLNHGEEKKASPKVFQQSDIKHGLKNSINNVPSNNRRRKYSES